MIVFGIVKVFSEASVAFGVILSTFDIKVANPAKLSIDITVFSNSRVFRNTGSFDFIFIIRVHGLLLTKLTDFTCLSLTNVFVKVLLVKVVISVVILRRGLVMTTIPACVGKLTIISVVLNHLFLSNFEPSRVSHAIRELENTLGILTSKWRVTIIRSNWRSHLREHTDIPFLLQSVHFAPE